MLGGWWVGSTGGSGQLCWQGSLMWRYLMWRDLMVGWKLAGLASCVDRRGNWNSWAVWRAAGLVDGGWQRAQEEATCERQPRQE